MKCYTIEIYFDDGTNIGWWTPDELQGKAFRSREEAEQWLEYNRDYYDILDANIQEEDYDEDEYEWYEL